jgi:Fur family transcriptional regulator, ferric uptake regulator
MSDPVAVTVRRKGSDVTVPHNGPALAPPTLDDAIGALRDRGLRASSARRLVLETLFAAEEPVSAERVADGLGGRFPRSDLASVYRNLETLEELGLVRHFHLVHGPGLYALAGRERDYLVCEGCGATRPVMPGALDDVCEVVERRFGLRPRFNHYPLVGLCEDCQ